jgi:hypothetical protein
MYEIGKVYIWQGQMGEFVYLNGTETAVLEGPVLKNDLSLHGFSANAGTVRTVWLTDSPLPQDFKGLKNARVYATAGDLRLKEPPNGERSILELFEKQPEPEVV